MHVRHRESGKRRDNAAWFRRVFSHAGESGNGQRVTQRLLSYRFFHLGSNNDASTRASMESSPIIFRRWHLAEKTRVRAQGSRAASIRYARHPSDERSLGSTRERSSALREARVSLLIVAGTLPTLLGPADRRESGGKPLLRKKRSGLNLRWYSPGK